MRLLAVGLLLALSLSVSGQNSMSKLSFVSDQCGMYFPDKKQRQWCYNFYRSVKVHKLATHTEYRSVLGACHTNFVKTYVGAERINLARCVRSYYQIKPSNRLGV